MREKFTEASGSPVQVSVRHQQPTKVERVIGAPVSSRNKDEGINSQGKLQVDNFDALVRILAASSIESHAKTDRTQERGTTDPQAKIS
jgi:hypothetical protein